MQNVIKLTNWKGLYSNLKALNIHEKTTNID